MKLMTGIAALSASAVLSLAGTAAAQCGSSTTTASAKSDCGSYTAKSDCGTDSGAYAVENVSMNVSAPTVVEIAVNAGSFDTLVAAVKAAGLVETLSSKGPFTVFAPTDDAFAKIPSNTLNDLLKPENKAALTTILTYHVVPGMLKAEDVVGKRFLTTASGQRLTVANKGDKGVMIDNARIVQTDIVGSNGVIHVLDTVVMPSTKNIVETASEAGSFGTLLAAAKAAGLADLLGSEGPFTVFAPSDEAFGKLGRDTINNLLKPENKHQLAEILKYHVVPGRVYAVDALTAGTAKTAQGSSIEVGLADGQLRVNNANIVATDIETTNGVIHVIDSVILPE